ncbi:MAG: glycosyltransferase family 4 protein [Pseudomonadota bacterium]
MKRLKVAVLSRNFSPTGGGAERYAIALVEQLAADHDIHVFAQTIEHVWPGVAYHVVGPRLRKPRWLNQLGFAFATWRATRSGFDVVHSHENTWHGDVQTAHVLPVHHNLLHDKRGVGRALRWLKVATSLRLITYLGLEKARLAPRAGRRIVAASQTLASTLAHSYPASAPMLSVITPGIDLPVASRRHERPVARRALGLPETGRCLLLVGNDLRKKGLGPLLTALADLPRDVFVAVAGNPEQAPAFKAQIERLELGGRVHFLGSQSDMSLAYCAADVLVHPTVEDTFAMVVLEAMAYGLPVVVSAARYCGISSLLTHGQNALLLADPRVATQIREQVGRVLEDKALRDGLSAEAIRFAGGYKWPEIAALQALLYVSVHAEKSRRTESVAT